ncbi:sugar transferase [Nocardioides sp. Kera G14]|uniref:sugar transferase n=1 Tax=Nocardioides sp. Kera G14 TaxID=2884264 RepID=UPI001D10ECD3|nr:sugar transferase [Nocardioides sp. Kera G14]UDY24918.1 sugar transferase [Nocardioides sp. Kera G14]
MADHSPTSWMSPDEVARLMDRPPLLAPAQDWRAAYVSARKVMDPLLLLATAAITLTVVRRLPDSVGPGHSTTYVGVSALVIASWLLIQSVVGVYERKLVVEGFEEYHRVVRAVIATVATVAVAAAASASSLSRLYLLLFFGIGATLLLGSRKLARRRLARIRHASAGGFNRVLVIGGARSARMLERAFRIHDREGYRVVGVWWPDPKAHYGPEFDILGSPVASYDRSHTLAQAVTGCRADAVIVTDTELLGNEGLKALGWALEGTGIDLLVSPNVVDVAGPRIHVRPVANLPLIHLDEPQYEGASRVGKALLDRVLAILGLLLASPVMLAIAVAIKLDDRGPVFYRSQRVGVGGQVFGMLKFRTMVVDAERIKAELTSDSDDASPLFKMREDPRITRVGRFLRRYSLDELPQLVNVLLGTMSVVGPRPPLPQEVETWEGGVERRLLVKQGMTGLWQVSGRSDLDWEDAVRLDLDYVENWSITRDLQIIWRTVRAVLSSDGAY